MKRKELHTAPVAVEYISVTVAQYNQAVTGKRTSHRTYWSAIKKMHTVADNPSSTALKDVSAPKESTQQKNRRKRNAGQKYSQMLLFPEVEETP